MERGGATEEDIRAVEQEIHRELEAAIAYATESPEPSVQDFSAFVRSN
jgi:TPP-dependent pyruvate/acetoin dehydrogenase alpha subunit